MDPRPGLTPGDQPADDGGLPAPDAGPGPSGGFRFLDVTAAAGIVDVGISYGASVGDIDGDGWPDVFTSGHFNGHPKLWRNRGDGTFEDQVGRMVPVPERDVHVAMFTDLDEDGDDEMVLSSGACFGRCELPTRCYVPDAGVLEDRAARMGLANELMRGRTPTAFDFRGDGDVDLFLAAAPRADGRAPGTIFEQVAPGSFQVDPILGLDGRFHDVGVLGDLDGDGRLDLLVDTVPQRAWSMVGGSASEITDAIGLPRVSLVRDVLIADLTGDGRNEIWYARSDERSGFHQENAETVEARLWLQRGGRHGIRLRPRRPAALSVTFPVGVVAFDNVLLGSAGRPVTTNRFTVAPQQAVGVLADPPVTPSLTIGWDPTAGEWEIRAEHDGFLDVMLKLETAAEFVAVTPIGFDPDTPAVADVVLVRGPNGWEDRAAALGVDLPLDSQSVVAADFDNDMDLDVFVLTGSPTRNPPDVLFENLGDGRFRRAEQRGFGGPDAGIGDAVVSLDHDRDGRIDLFTVHGRGRLLLFESQPNAFADDGPVQLLRNVTPNRNHWLGIELVGTTSHRDAVGARVEVVCGERVQVREHGGGIHRHAQNHGIHFGLGRHAAADRVRVVWPSGRVTELRDVAADRYLSIVE